MDNHFISYRGGSESAQKKSVSTRLQIVKAGDVRFGIPTVEIATIVTWQKPTPLPHAPKSILGVVSIQGRMLTALDLKILTKPDSSETGNEAKSHLIALRGDEQLAIAVDSLGQEIDVENHQLQQSTPANQLICQILRVDNSDVGVLDVKQIFPAAIQGRERRRRRF